MNIVIGYGNPLRGEDGFGLAVIDYLRKKRLPKTKLVTTYQLTPELTLDLKNAKNIIFVDAALGTPHYAIASPLKVDNSGFSHHISPHTIIAMLQELFSSHPKYLVYSILTDAFETIQDEMAYKRSIKEVGDQIEAVL